MGWPWWAPASYYGRYDYGRLLVAEGSCASEHLIWPGMTVSQNSTGSGSFSTYLDHDHRERKNVTFLTTCLSVQDLWCSPSQGNAESVRVVPHRTLVSHDRRAAKARNACVARVVDKDVQLIGCQYSGEIRPRTGRTPLIPP